MKDFNLSMGGEGGGRAGGRAGRLPHEMKAVIFSRISPSRAHCILIEILGGF